MNHELSIRLVVGMLAVLTLAVNAHAADIKDCPEASAIKSKPFHDDSVPGDYGDGFTYTATSNGKTWTGTGTGTGTTLGTDDDYLAAKYALKVETFGVVDGKLRCDYGGKRLVENSMVKEPNLRLSAPQ